MIYLNKFVLLGTLLFLIVFIISCPDKGNRKIPSIKHVQKEIILFQSSEKRPEWIDCIPKEDDQYIYFVGISLENVLSEREAKRQAIADVRTQVVQFYGTKVKHEITTIDISFNSNEPLNISKEFERQFSQNVANFVHTSEVYSEKWLRKSSIIRWKVFVLCTVPKIIVSDYINEFLIEIKRERKLKDDSRKRCNKFQNDADYYKVRGFSYLDSNEALKNAIYLFKKKIIEETTKKYNIEFQTEHERELSCPDIDGKYYYIVGINYSKLDKQAVNEIIKKANNFNYNQMVDILNKNKRLFANINHNKLLNQIQSALQYIKVNKEKLKNALDYEAKHNFFKSLKLLGSTKTFNSEFFKYDIDQIFKEIIKNKKRISELYFKGTLLQIKSLLKSYVPYNNKDKKNKSVKEQIDQILSKTLMLEKTKELNDNNYYDDFNECIKRYNDILEFEKILKEKGFIYVNSINPFYISKHEVTVREYIPFYNSTHHEEGNQCSQRLKIGQNLKESEKQKFFNPYKELSNNLSNWIIKDKRMTPKKNKAHHPMNCVSWDEANFFMDWLNHHDVLIDSYHYRFCTASEWEYAARNEGENRSSYISRDKSLLREYACFDQLKVGTCKTGSKKPNDLGLYDMSGNVSEWVADDDPRYEMGKKDKGGSYWSSNNNIKLETTTGTNKKERFTSMGFRICISK